MYLFSHPQSNALPIAMLGGIFFIFALIVFIVGLFTLRKKPREGIELLIVAFVICIVGAGFCGLSQG